MQPYRTLHERIAGVVLTFTDITERRRQQLVEREAAGQLEQRCALLEAMLAALPDAVCVFDAQRRLAYVNAAARRFWTLGETSMWAGSLAALGRRASLGAALDRQLQRALETATAGRDGERRGALLATDPKAAWGSALPPSRPADRRRV